MVLNWLNGFVGGDPTNITNAAVDSAEKQNKPYMSDAGM